MNGKGFKLKSCIPSWIPAFAGMTLRRLSLREAVTLAKARVQHFMAHYSISFTHPSSFS